MSFLDLGPTLEQRPHSAPLLIPSAANVNANANASGQPSASDTMPSLPAVGNEVKSVDVLALVEVGEGRNDSRSPSKTRSLSDTGPPTLSPSPKFREPTKRASKDDSVLHDSPTTPRRPSFLSRLSLQMPPRDLISPTSAHVNRTPLSPQLDHSDTYGSQASVLPRRSRGLDFSRAATNLHHSTLAEQSSPDSSPTLSGRAMNIPNRRNGAHFNGMDSPNTNPSSLWSTMGNSDRMNVSSSLGSVYAMDTLSSSSDSDNEDMMDADDIDDSILTTPQISRNSGTFGMGAQPSPGNLWMNGQSPAVSSLMSFQRARLRNGRNRKSSSSASGSSMNSPGSRSPPIRSIEGVSNGYFTKESSRRESISWAANQLNISGSESDDGRKGKAESEPPIPRDGQRGVVRRAVTRRGNMLPKTKGFARVRAALMEESAPIETEFRREADVVRQVRESDSEFQLSHHTPASLAATTHSSPSLGPVPNPQESLEDIPEDDMMMVGETSHGEKLSGSFKHQAIRNSKGKEFWENFDGINSTPPPPSFLPRASSISDDISMDSPSNSTPSSLYTTTSGSQIFNTMAFSYPPNGFPDSQQSSSSSYNVPSAAEISRKVNNKRRRNNDDFDDDPINFKRRAVSPGSAMSVHNSPILQSPMQRDVHPWGSRPAASASAGAGANTASAAGGAGVTEANGNVNGTPKGAVKRVGMQGMADTNDGLMKMSID